MEAKHVLGSQNMIGEGPVWNEEEGALYWVDIGKATINRFWPQSGDSETFQLDAPVGVFAFRERGGLITAGSAGFGLWNPGDETLEPITDPERDNPDSRFNDGKVDRGGRFWAGTMTMQGAVSALYRMDPDLSVHKMESGLTISNGIGWSPDDRTMYFVDSMRYVIYAYDFDLEAGEMANRRSFVTVDESYGIPDGLTVDVEGYVWCAFYGTSRVTRFDPQGGIDAEVTLPVSQPTSCIFGGPDYTDLYVTSAWNGLPEEQREAEPMAGDLFVIKTDVPGRPEPAFAG